MRVGSSPPSATPRGPDTLRDRRNDRSDSDARASAGSSATSEGTVRTRRNASSDDNRPEASSVRT